MSEKAWHKTGTVFLSLFVACASLALINLVVVSVNWHVMTKIEWLPYLQMGLLATAIASAYVAGIAIVASGE